jgi:hypothetical protein
MTPKSYKEPDKCCYKCKHAIHSTQLTGGLFYGFYCIYNHNPYDIIITNMMVNHFYCCDEFESKTKE